MDEKVQAEYDDMIRRAVAKNGMVVARGSTQYGWVDFIRHAQTSCPITVTGKVDEDASWSEFKGTFYEGDTSVYGIEATGANCACGAITDRTIRWSASPGEIIRAVFEEMAAMIVKVRSE